MQPWSRTTNGPRLSSYEPKIHLPPLSPSNALSLSSDGDILLFHSLGFSSMSTISNPTLSYVWLPWSEIRPVRPGVNLAPTFQHRAQLCMNALKGTYKMERIETTKIVRAARNASVDWILFGRNGFRDRWCRSPLAADGGRQKNQMRLTAFVGWSGTPHKRGKKGRAPHATCCQGPIADQQQAHSRPFPITPNLPASKSCAALNPDSFHRMEPKGNTAYATWAVGERDIF